MKGREFMIAGVAGVCTLPSAVCNVLPHLDAALARESSAVGALSFQAVAVFALAAMPFAMKKASSISAKAGFFTLAVILFSLSFLNAVDMASHVRESATGVARGSLAKAAGLNSRIRESEKARNQLPPFDFTSAAQVTAARNAVDNAEKSRDLECKRVGEMCRSRMNEVTVAQEKLAKLAAARELTEKAETIDHELAETKGELLRLGPLPKHADATAARVARMVGMIVSLGNDGEESVAEWRPIVSAIGVELLAFLGPFALVMAFGPAGSATVAIMQQPANSGKRQGERKDAAIETPAPAHAGVGQTPATPAKVKKISPIKSKAPAGVDTVREWFDSRTAARAGHEVRVNECHADYLVWCKERGIRSPWSLTKFGLEMRDNVKVEKVERSKRVFYVGFVLRPAGLKVVSG